MGAAQLFHKVAKYLSDTELYNGLANCLNYEYFAKPLFYRLNDPESNIIVPE